MGFLEEFYKQAQKNGKIKSNADLGVGQKAVDTLKDKTTGKADFYGVFASQLDPEFGKQLSAGYDQKKKYLDRIKAFEDAAAQADKEAAANNNSNILRDTKKYAPSVLGNEAKAIGAGFVDSFRPFATGIARSLPGGTADLQAAGQGSTQQSDTIAQVANKLQDKSVQGREREHLQLLLDNLQKDKAPAQALLDVTKQIKSDTDRRKFLASAAQVALTVAAPTGLSKAGELGTLARAGVGAAEGAALGGTQALTQDQVSAGSVIKSAAIGGALGGALTGASALVENNKSAILDALGKNKEAKGATAITDEARLLPSQAGEGAPVITDKSRLLGAPEANPNIAPRVNPADPQLVKRLNTVDAKIRLAQQTSNITVDEAKALVRERQALVSEIQRQSTPVTSQADLVRVPRGNAKPFSGSVDAVTQNKVDDLISRAEATPRPEGTVRVFQATGKGAKSDWVFDNVDSLQAFKNNVTGTADNFTFRDVPASSLKPTKNGEGVFRLTNETPMQKLSSIDEQIVKEKDPVKVAALAADRQALTQTLPAPERKLANDAAVVSKQAVNSEISSVAQNTEQRAISKGLTKGFDNLPTYEKANFAAQRSAVNDAIKTNYNDVLDVALGRKTAPDGIEAAHFYRAIEDKALKDGDEATLQLLATSSKLPEEATKRGQYNAAFGYKDPNSPVDSIREINTLRDAAQKRGINVPKQVSSDEARNIIDLAKTAENKKTAWLDAGGKIDDPNRLEYGRAQVAFRNNVDALKQEAAKQTLKEKGFTGTVKDLASNTKSLQSSMDNSALFRQGWKTLWTNPKEWSRNSLKTWQDIVKTFGGKDTLNEVAADIVSRPNADKYRAMKLAVGIDEEAFPTSFPEKIPLLGRAYKASEAAYTGFLQRQRADIADKYLEIAQKTGVDITDKKQLEGIGKLVNSLTGRGHLGKLETSADTLNSIFFSPRMLKSNIDVLTAHQFQQGVTPFVRKQAAKNLLKIVSGTAAVLATADIARPGSVEWDPRSSNFGKIKIGNTRFDVSGGMGSVTTLASRLAAWSKKSSTTGDIKSLTGGGFGSGDGADLVIDFFENKLSPAGGVIRDLLRGEDFNGNKPNAKNIAIGLTVPLVLQNAVQAKQPNSANQLLATIADGLGISANTYSSSPNWKVENSKELKAFQDKVGKGKFDQAFNDFNRQYSEWYANTEKNDRFKKLSNDDKQLVRQNKAKALRTDVLKQYGFEYNQEKKAPGRLKGF